MLFRPRNSLNPLSPKVISSLASEIDATSNRVRARKDEQRVHFRKVVEQLVVNLITASSASHNYLSVSLDKNEYQKPHLRDKDVTYALFHAAYKGLLRLGYITVAKSFYYDNTKGEGQRTRVEATEKLLSLFEDQKEEIVVSQIPETHTPVVVLRDRDEDDEKFDIEYRPNPQTRAWTKNLAKINRVLAGTWIDIDTTEEGCKLELQKLRKTNKKRGNELKFDPLRRTLHRVFNDGSFDNGGRFYGAWWMEIPSQFRKYILIAGRNTEELDYKAIHPTIAYALAGIPIETDPYSAVMGEEHRKAVKLAMTRMFGAPKRSIEIPPEFKEMKFHLSWKELKKRIYDHHEPIQSSFYTGAGNHLMHLDSQIAEKVLLHFANLPTPAACLPIHDSFCIHTNYIEELKEVMYEAFMELVGHEAEIKLDLSVFDDWKAQTTKNSEKDRVYQSLDLNEIMALSEADKPTQRHKAFMRNRKEILERFR
jgi:hypothetical protein